MFKKLVKRCLLPVFKLYLRVRPAIWQLQGEALLSMVKNRDEGCIFEGPGVLIDPDELHLGRHVYIGRNCFVRATGGVYIGNYSHISRNVVIHTVNHNVEGDLLPYDRNDVLKGVHIGDYVWIGMNVNILPGVRIGNGAVIGMGTTVSKDVNEGEVVVGESARVAKRRDMVRMRALAKDNKFLKNRK